MNNRQPIDNVRYAPFWWRHGPVVRLQKNGEIIGYKMDLYFEHTDEYDSEMVLKQLDESEKKHLTKWPFLDLLDKDELRLKLDTLPTEFFSHQLLDVDLSNELSVFRFLCEWGFPYSPARNNELCCGNYGSLFFSSKEGIFETEDILKNGNTPRICISIKEAVSTLAVFQSIVSMMFDAIENDSTPLLDMEPVNAASCNPFYLISYPSISLSSPQMTDLEHRGMLTCAIANQIIDAMRDEAPWKKCACVGCRVLFKRKQSGRNNPDSKSIYCSSRCEQKQCKRNQRAAAKARIKH